MMVLHAQMKPLARFQSTDGGSGPLVEIAAREAMELELGAVKAQPNSCHRQARLLALKRRMTKTGKGSRTSRPAR
jgi:hypothetical protein